MTKVLANAINPRLTNKGLLVLKTFLSSREEQLSGANIMDKTALYSGTIYPILIRFEKAGWLTSKWEEGDPSALGRPLNKYYSITHLGREKAQFKMDEMQRKIKKLTEYIAI